ncbi:DUF4395 domain-containing protein [Nocardioides sp.]|uniref:DUF4395 domain-containing protein n=1 Tax=Nocardioides sp. TaxID=35761 RepID=UPI002D1FA9BD|nr:DUF4395 domain-containing protein [Nocardioides sp.]
MVSAALGFWAAEAPTMLGFLFWWARGAALGGQRTPHAWVFRRFVRPRLAPPAELEDAAPPRFAQAVGLAFALVGLLGFLTGATALGLVATGLALGAALLNAVFGLCLGCEMYLLGRRVLGRRQSGTPRRPAARVG